MWENAEKGVVSEGIDLDPPHLRECRVTRVAMEPTTCFVKGCVESTLVRGIHITNHWPGGLGLSVTYERDGHTRQKLRTINMVATKATIISYQL